MQTFLPYPSFSKSAKVLDYHRLGKQRLEAKQIYLALTEPGYGWQNHPAVKMWRGYEAALAQYGKAICFEWHCQRGYKDSLLSWFEERATPVCIYPKWIYDPNFHLAHQSNLLRKDPAFYTPLFPGVPADLPYIWPVA
jgi:hypothetical protein